LHKEKEEGFRTDRLSSSHFKGCLVFVDFPLYRTIVHTEETSSTVSQGHRISLTPTPPPRARPSFRQLIHSDPDNVSLGFPFKRQAFALISTSCKEVHLRGFQTRYHLLFSDTIHTPFTVFIMFYAISLATFDFFVSVTNIHFVAPFTFHSSYTYFL
jgi:hypothetical protein